MKLSKKKENFLDFVPIRSRKISWKAKDELVQLVVYKNSILDKITRKLFFTPEKFIIDLDTLGSFVWKNIDGQKNIYEISKQVKDTFGEDAEPLYDRLIQFMIILKNNNFIKLT